MPRLQPVLDALGSGALVIGGLVSAAWLSTRPVGLPVRATRDVDLGINRVALGVRKDHAPIRPLLVKHGFQPGFGGEEFRFFCEIDQHPFVVDLLLPSGASRAKPPEVERGIATLEAPGLRYAIDRGPVPMEARTRGGRDATLRHARHHAGRRLRHEGRPGRQRCAHPARQRVVDTADAIMLAAACAADQDAMAALVAKRRSGGPKKAIRWITESFASEGAAAARRMVDHIGEPAGAAWAVAAAAQFEAQLAAASGAGGS